MTNKIIVLGKGFLGKEFERQGFEVWGRDKWSINHVEAPYLLGRTLRKLDSFDVIINCIAKSNTRWCEDKYNFPEAMFVNGMLPYWFSEYCMDNAKKFVHISTGCLYDRFDRENTEKDFIAAHCNYTVTKWAGEQGCIPYRDLILRPRLFFGDTHDKNNLLNKLPKFKEYTNMYNSFTCVSEVVKATKALLEQGQCGIFNVANEGKRSIYEIAKLIGLNGSIIQHKELCKQQGVYLVNSVLDITKLKQYYQPQKIDDAVLDCWRTLSGGSGL